MNESVQTTRGLNTIFIHSSLDDAGLTAQQFRVYAHISRRAGDGDCWASNATIGKVCRLSKNCVYESLNELQRRGFIEREDRPGKTTVWTVTARSKWNLEAPVKKQGRGRIESTQTNTQPKQYPTQTNTQLPHPNNSFYPTQTNTYEGNPIKVIPPKVIPKESVSLELQEARALWIQAYNELNSKPYKTGGKRQQAEDTAGIKQLLADGMTPEEIKATACAAFQLANRHDPKYWTCEKVASMAFFASNINKIEKEIAASGPTTKPMTDEDRRIEEIHNQIAIDAFK